MEQERRRSTKVKLDSNSLYCKTHYHLFVHVFLSTSSLRLELPFPPPLLENENTMARVSGAAPFGLDVLEADLQHWRGEEAYSAATFVDLNNVESPQNNKNRGSAASRRSPSPRRGAKLTLSREIAQYEVPPHLRVQSMDEQFLLEKKYLDLYKQKLEKEIKREESLQKKPANEKQSSLMQELRSWREKQKEQIQKETEERDKKLSDMQEITQATEQECRKFLKKYDWDVKIACEQYFNGEDVSGS
ncbi:unnamed protein product [Amoebophrya sp. A120]|nr:unnamed protein product [Amoebophrya sp. A120]|eukprot:GSA120T00019177001.1